MYQPSIKLELEQMRIQIIHQLTAHNKEIEKAVSDELTKVINNYDFEATISKISHEVIEDEIESYFKYGNGNGILKNSVRVALDQTFSKLLNNALET